MAQWLERWARDRGSRVRVHAETAGEFSSPESAFCVDSYFSVRSTAVLPQWHVKDPGHFAESAVAGYSYTHMHHTYVALHEVKRFGRYLKVTLKSRTVWAIPQGEYEITFLQEGVVDEPFGQYLKVTEITNRLGDTSR